MRRGALMAVLLVGCDQMVQPADVALAEELCAKRNGFAKISRFEGGNLIVIICKDGINFQVRLNDVKER